MTTAKKVYKTTKAQRDAMKKWQSKNALKYKAYQKVYRKSDKYKAYQKVYQKAYRKSDKYKAYKKAYNAETRKALAAYRASKKTKKQER